MKKAVSLFVLAAILVAAFTGCSNNPPASSGNPGAEFDASKAISVTSREDGSGTRGAFVELMGIEQADADGNKSDMTTPQASINNSTAVMMATVAGNPYAIGYISLGSMNNTVRAVKVDGVEATVENIKSGAYKVARPFNIATKGDAGDAAQDFINFILSGQGQSTAEEAGYISAQSGADFSSNKAAGKVVVAGSSSVTPLMEKLKEAYAPLNPNAEIEIQPSDSSTGIKSVIEGVCDIGMASRDLKESETGAGVTPQVIAMDGIAVIVNNANPSQELTSDQIQRIFTGDLTKWSDING